MTDKEICEKIIARGGCLDIEPVLNCENCPLDAVCQGFEDSLELTKKMLSRLESEETADYPNPLNSVCENSNYSVNIAKGYLKLIEEKEKENMKLKDEKTLDLNTPMPEITCGMICETKEGNFYINFPKDDREIYWINKEGRFSFTTKSEIVRLYIIRSNHNYYPFFGYAIPNLESMDLIWERNQVTKEDLTVSIKGKTIDISNLSDETVDRILKDVREL